MPIVSLPGWVPPLVAFLALVAAADVGAWLICRSSLAARRRWPALLAPMLLALAAPFLMPRRWLVLRLILFVMGGLRPLKYWDAFHELPALPAERTSLGRFLFFLLAPPYTLRYGESLVREDPARAAPRSVKVRAMALGAARIGAGLLLREASLRWHPWEVSLWLNHLFKVFELYLIAGGGVDVLLSIGRLAGLRAKDILDYPILARDPADFWRRYNTPVHDWTARYIFRPLGGVRHPGRGVLAVFVASGLLHEYIFSFASLKGWGYQTSFFLWQGVGALVAMRGSLRRGQRSLRGQGGRRRGPAPTGWWLALRIAAQITFFLITSVLFLASFEKSIPLHAGAPTLLR